MSAKHDRIISLSGVFEGFNLSPKGVPEGLMIQSDDAESSEPIQVNFDPELVGQVTQIVKPGQVVNLEVIPFGDAEQDAHPVYDLIRLIGADGKLLVAEGKGEPWVRVIGKVVRINFARRGEANGGILDTGDFVHLRPHGARAIELHLGQQINAEGEVRAGWSGVRVVEADVANGIEIGKPPHKHGPKHDHLREHPKKTKKPKPHHAR